MKKLKTQDKILITKSVGLTIAIFLILLGLFSGFSIDLIFLVWLLIIVNLIILTLLEIFERRLKIKK